MDIIQQLFPLPPIPTLQQAVFIPLALFTAVCALLVVLSPNLFHNALALVGTLFGVAGIYALLEAEFLAISQILVYVWSISTLITFAIMLSRGMMFGATSKTNKQAGTAIDGIVVIGFIGWCNFVSARSKLDVSIAVA
ncbi:MAG: NADH-quinone oxidoreductase subunit J [Chloroflexi bacterium]|nr:NADH-quinone oxidoreductase subunit J [Chloroflexota bacterium]